VDISEETQIIKTTTAADLSFKIELNINWGAQSPNHRIQIREHLFEEEAEHFSSINKFNLYNLQMLPQAQDGYFSISHCQKIGGYAFAKGEVGFDIEEKIRVSEPIIIRTSTADEIKMAPQKKFLWVAKEAAFKALSAAALEMQKTLVMTQIHCHQWKMISLDSSLWSFEVQLADSLELKKNKGFVFEKNELLFGVFFR